MKEDVAKTQVVILGLIDYLSDVFDNTKRKEIRDSLLLAIRANFTNRLLLDPEISAIIKPVLQTVGPDESLEMVSKKIIDGLQGKEIKVNPSSLLKESSKEVLNELVDKTDKSDLQGIINLSLQ